MYSSECVLCVEVWPYVLSSQAKHCQYLPWERSSDAIWDLKEPWHNRPPGPELRLWVEVQKGFCSLSLSCWPWNSFTCCSIVGCRAQNMRKMINTILCIYHTLCAAIFPMNELWVWHFRVLLNFSLLSSIFFIFFVSIAFRKSYEHLFQYFLLIKLLSTYVLRTKTVLILFYFLNVHLVWFWSIIYLILSFDLWE